jgi:hypothetical protein
MQNLKAVAVGVVVAITFFWPNRPNPATPGRGAVQAGSSQSAQPGGAIAAVTSQQKLFIFTMLI